MGPADKRRASVGAWIAIAVLLVVLGGIAVALFLNGFRGAGGAMIVTLIAAWLTAMNKSARSDR